jgi:AraC-like DNA-binding protein
MNIYSERAEASFNEGMLKRSEVAAPGRMEVLVSCCHHPSAVARGVFNVVLASGHFQGRRGDRLEPFDLPGHQFLYCLRGSGYSWSGGKEHWVGPSEVAWLAASGRWRAENEPWEILWICVDGHQVRQACGFLGVEDKPIFKDLPKEETGRVFRSVHDLLIDPHLEVDSALNRNIAQLIGYLLDSRQPTRKAGKLGIQDAYPELSGAFLQIAADPQRSWRACELAKLCGLSERHFFRRFKKATGLSPISWLKMQRISLAQSKLLESGHSIKQIADQVGYNDVFFFSRDFKRHTGTCPSQYRREHSSPAKGQASTALV